MIQGLRTTLKKQPTIIILGNLDDTQKNKGMDPALMLLTIKWGKEKINYTFTNIYTI